MLTWDEVHVHSLHPVDHPRRFGRLELERPKVGSQVTELTESFMARSSTVLIVPQEFPLGWMELNSLAWLIRS
jgi:hypothetical protein